MTRRTLCLIALGALSRRLSAQPPAPLAVELARVLNRIKFSDLSPQALQHAKMLISSTLASAASGYSMGSARIIRDLVKERGGRPEATVWFDGAKLPVTEVARVNAMFSDAAASDDSDLRNVAHTGTALVACGLAIGEQTDATGPDLLTAIVTGYEAAGRIGDALSGGRSGFHASVIVAFGAVVAVSKLLRLTDDQMAHAIGITSTTMGGLQIGTNSWAREYHAGNAALCAVNAAQAAARGYTVNPDLLEARGGFLSVFGDGKTDTKKMTREMTGGGDIVKYLAIKLVPGAHAFQSSAEAAVNAARKANVPPEDIARILVSGPQVRGAVNSRPPKDMVEAIHSLPYFVASAIADKDFSWVHATPEKIHRPVVTRLMSIVEADPQPPAIHYDWTWGGTVSIVTKSGARATSTVDAPRGSGPRGIEWNDVDAKYHALMPAGRFENTLQLIRDFDQVKQVRDFVRSLTP